MSWRLQKTEAYSKRKEKVIICTPNQKRIVSVVKIISEETFNGLHSSDDTLKIAEYEHCVFKNYNFQGCDLSGFKFIDCEFEDCNLSSAIMKNTSLQNIEFRRCKILGVHFDDCNGFGLSLHFENCQLNHSIFYQLQLPKTKFNGSKLIEVDFGECDLIEAHFEGCDLSGAIFENCDLAKADFRNAINYHLDPEQNKLKGARFSVEGLHGLLGKYQIKVEQ